jgi:hypothetical protein
MWLEAARFAVLAAALALAACAAHGPAPEDARWFQPPYEACSSLDCGW